MQPGNIYRSFLNAVYGTLVGKGAINAGVPIAKAIGVLRKPHLIAGAYGIGQEPDRIFQAAQRFSGDIAGYIGGQELPSKIPDVGASKIDDVRRRERLGHLFFTTMAECVADYSLAGGQGLYSPLTSEVEVKVVPYLEEGERCVDVHINTPMLGVLVLQFLHAETHGVLYEERADHTMSLADRFRFTEQELGFNIGETPYVVALKFIDQSSSG